MAKEENGDLTPVVKHMAPAIEQVDEATRNPVGDLVNVRNIRASINNALISQGIPTTDPEMMNLILKNLKDMDASSLGQMRIAIEEKSADVAEEQKNLAAAALNYIFENKTAGVKPVNTGPVNTEVPSLSEEEVRPEEFIPGETKVGTVIDNFESFSQRTGGEIKLQDEEGEDELA